MSLKEMKKEDLELLSYKDITNIILNEEGSKNTKDLFKEIVDLLGLSSSVFETKIGDYYTTLTTDKRFVLLADGCWDLKSRHISDKIVVSADEEEDEEESLDMDSDEVLEDDDESSYDSTVMDDYDDTDDDLQDLAVVDEDELELEQ